MVGRMSNMRSYGKAPRKTSVISACHSQIDPVEKNPVKTHPAIASSPPSRRPRRKMHPGIFHSYHRAEPSENERNAELVWRWSHDWFGALVSSTITKHSRIMCGLCQFLGAVVVIILSYVDPACCSALILQQLHSNYREFHVWRVLSSLCERSHFLGIYKSISHILCINKNYPGHI